MMMSDGSPGADHVGGLVPFLAADHHGPHPRCLLGPQHDAPRLGDTRVAQVGHQLDGGRDRPFGQDDARVGGGGDVLGERLGVVVALVHQSVLSDQAEPPGTGDGCPEPVGVRLVVRVHGGAAVAVPARALHPADLVRGHRVAEEAVVEAAVMGDPRHLVQPARATHWAAATW